MDSQVNRRGYRRAKAESLHLHKEPLPFTLFALAGAHNSSAIVTLPPAESGRSSPIALTVNLHVSTASKGTASTFDIPLVHLPHSLDADIVLFNLDHHRSQFGLPDKADAPTRGHLPLYAVTGHDAVHVRPSMWLNRTYTRQFDFAVHWGTGADVPLVFFDDRLLLRRAFSTPNGSYWFDSYDQVRDRTYSDATMLSSYLNECTGERMFLLKGLSQLLPITHYGKCAPAGPETVAYDGVVNDSVILDLIGRHRFHLALEAYREPGLVSSALFESLAAGSVPIYYGDDSVGQFVPRHSLVFLGSIDVGNATRVNHTASHIAGISKSHRKYMHYHKWRRDPEQASVQFRRLASGSRTTALHRMCAYAHVNKLHLVRRSELFLTLAEGWASEEAYVEQTDNKAALITAIRQSVEERKAAGASTSASMLHSAPDQGFFLVIVFVFGLAVRCFMSVREGVSI